MVEIDLAEYPGTFTAVGYEPTVSGLTVEQAETLVSHFDSEATEFEVHAYTSLWTLADLLVWSEDNLGDAFSQITPDPTRNRRSYSMLMRISRAFADHERRYSPEAMSIWTHGEVYNLPEYLADELLESYAAGELTREQLRQEAQSLRFQLKGGEPTILIPEGSTEQPRGSEAKPSEADEAPVCPLCLGAGHVPEEQREAFLEWMANSAREGTLLS